MKEDLFHKFMHGGILWRSDFSVSIGFDVVQVMNLVACAVCVCECVKDE